MSNRFFEHPILYSPYEYPTCHWELEDGQPTQKIIERRRRAEFITPIPKPKKRRGSPAQQQIVFDEGKGLSTKQQQYDPTSIINELRNRLISGANCQAVCGKSHRKQLVSSNTGVITPSAASALSSAKK